MGKIFYDLDIGINQTALSSDNTQFEILLFAYT